MSRFFASLGVSLSAVLRGLRVPGFYLVLLISVASWALAYQYKTTYTVDLGGTTDNAYVFGFNDKERNDNLNYRWSGSRSEVHFPGVGNQPVVLSLTTIGYRPDGSSPVIQVEARGQTFTLQTHGEPHSDSFPTLPRGDPLDGDVTVVISAPTFSPSSDPRRLGVLVDRVSLAPAGYDLRPVVIPPPGALLGLLAGVVGAYLSALITTRRILIGISVAVAIAAVYACLVVVARPELALHAAQLPSLWAWGLPLALLARGSLDALIPPRTRAAGFLAGVSSAAFVAAFLVRFGGTTYPQFLSSDLLLHAHNVQHILDGRWLFTQPLPDGTPAPYPNALYVLLSPFAALLGRSDEAIGLLLKWTAALFDGATCLALAWAGPRLWPGRAGGVAALAYAISPAPFVLLSAGNYSNVFAQAALNVTLLGGIVFLGRRTKAEADKVEGRWGFAWSVARRPSSLVLLTTGFALTVLGHYGMMLATLGIMGIFGVCSVWETVRRGRAPEAWIFIGTWAAALLASFAAYYGHFTGEMWQQWSGLLRRLVGTGASAVPGGNAQATAGLVDFAGKRLAWIGPLAAIIALFGATQLRGLTRLSRALLVSWLLAALAFALLDQALGDTVRWYYLGAAPVALLAGRYLSLLSTRRGAATLLAALSLLAMLLHTLGFWVGELIFVRYH